MSKRKNSRHYCDQKQDRCRPDGNFTHFNKGCEVDSSRDHLLSQGEERGGSQLAVQWKGQSFTMITIQLGTPLSASQPECRTRKSPVFVVSDLFVCPLPHIAGAGVKRCQRPMMATPHVIFSKICFVIFFSKINKYA